MKTNIVRLKIRPDEISAVLLDENEKLSLDVVFNDQRLRVAIPAGIDIHQVGIILAGLKEEEVTSAPKIYDIFSKMGGA